jgi:hypothetical protein
LAKKRSSLLLAAGDADLTATVLRSKRMLNRRAIMSGAAGGEKTTI